MTEKRVAPEHVRAMEQIAEGLMLWVLARQKQPDRAEWPDVAHSTYAMGVAEGARQLVWLMFSDADEREMGEPLTRHARRIRRHGVEYLRQWRKDRVNWWRHFQDDGAGGYEQ